VDPFDAVGVDVVGGDALDQLGQADAGLEPEQIGTVLRTGGSSRLPSFRARLDRIFPGRVSDRDAFTAVAKGLGARAGELWGATV